MLVDYKSPEEIVGKDGLLKQFTKALLERAMQVEMNTHLGYEKHDPKGLFAGFRVHVVAFFGCYEGHHNATSETLSDGTFISPSPATGPATAYGG